MSNCKSSSAPYIPEMAEGANAPDTRTAGVDIGIAQGGDPANWINPDNRASADSRTSSPPWAPIPPPACRPTRVRLSTAGRSKSVPSRQARYSAKALGWAESRVVVVQQCLPWPFTGALPYAVLDNRPMHRAPYSYARNVHAHLPRTAKRCFLAMVYANPTDNMGARDFVSSSRPSLTLST